MKALSWSRFLIPLGFTAILVAYFLIWLPQPVTGLSFIGLEMGEWVKFLPKGSAGDLTYLRNIFYLPPITLGLMMILWTVNWTDKRWQTWIVRGLAVAVAFLALPSIEVILDEPVSEWLLRLLMVLCVLALAVISPLFKRLAPGSVETGSWVLILLLGLIGLIFPTWIYASLRDLIGDLLQTAIGIGPGVWLNAAGHLLLVGSAAALLATGTNKDPQTDLDLD